MAASYPTAVKSFTTKADGVDIYQAAHVNDLQDEVTAIEQDLRTNGGAPTGQIKFPATQNPSADANTLDDYEEGTWTPTFSGTVGNGVFSNTRYVKVGSKVHFWITFVWGITTSCGAGTAQTFTLPFTAASPMMVGVALLTDASAVTFYPCVAFLNGTTAVSLVQSDVAATSVMTGTIPFTFAAGDSVIISGCFTV